MLIRFNIHIDKLPEFIIWFNQYPFAVAKNFTVKNQVYEIVINIKDLSMVSMVLLRWEGEVISSNQETVEFIGTLL